MEVGSVEQTSADDLRRVAMRLAVEVVKSAHEEAMFQHGMLRSTVTLISTYAQANLDALDAQGDP